MEIRRILTRRNDRSQNYSAPIIYEWEDDISRELNVPVVPLSFLYRVVNHFDIHSCLLSPWTDVFRFVINGKDYDEPMNYKNIIPCIIDFFEKEKNIQDFYKKHSNNKIVLLSSPFDYQYLKERNCPINIGLFAYSLSDRYSNLAKTVEKKYDIVLTGRQDPLLYSFFKEYVKKHPNVTYVKRGKELENDDKKTQDYYLNGKENLGAIVTRDEFMTLQAQGRATLYGVQGYDERTRDFYHMTPHFLEIIACGCHVLAHYPNGKDGVDAEYYEFNKFSPSIETYVEFEEAMDFALSNEIDINMYSTYLKKHYTSTRVKELREVLKGL